MLCSLLKSHCQFVTCLKEGEAEYVDLILFRCNYMVMETCWRSSLSCFFTLSTLFRIKGFEKFIIASVVRMILLSSRCGHNVQTLGKHTHNTSFFLILFLSFRLPLRDWSISAGTCWQSISHVNIRAGFTLWGFFNIPTITLCGVQGRESVLELTQQAAPCPVSSPREGDLTQNRQINSAQGS